MSVPFRSAQGVSANFTFQGTNTSSIQQNNFLAVDIGIHSPNCCVDGIDYGYRSDVFLYRNATEVFAASGWKFATLLLPVGDILGKNYFFLIPADQYVARR